MAITTGTQLKMVQVSTLAKYSDITPKEPGTLYWVVEVKKVYLDGVAYGFNSNDISSNTLAEYLAVNNTNRSVILDIIDEGPVNPLEITADVKIHPDPDNLLYKYEDGSLIVQEDEVWQVADGVVQLKVLDKLGQTNGIATLDAAGKVPQSQLPSYVDDVLEFSSRSAFPGTGEAGKIYIAMDTNITYRWGGTTYVEISPSLALGTTASTAFRGDYGNVAYQHVSKTDNPHGVTKSQVGLGSVQNYGLASQAQAEAGSVNNVYMTPLRTKQAIDKLAPKVTWTVIT